MRLRLTTFVIFLILFFSSTSTVFSQRKGTKNSLKGKGTIFIELLGNGGLYSLNYDRIFYHKKRDAMSWRAGLAWGLYSDDFIKTSQMSFLGEFNYLRGKTRHFLELGIGVTYWTVFRVDQDEYINFYLIPRIGYRFQKAEGGFFFRVGATPFVHFARDRDRNIFLRGGVSLGYTFQSSRTKISNRRNSEGPRH